MFFRTALACLAAVAFGTGATAADATASVTVLVPVGATLNINNQPTQQMTAVRMFVTPELPSGKRFRYNLEATFTWYGEEVTKRKQVDMPAGTTVSVDMMQAETVVKPPVRAEEEIKPVEPPKPAPKPEVKPVEMKPEPPKPEPEQPKAPEYRKVETYYDANGRLFIRTQ